MISRFTAIYFSICFFQINAMGLFENDSMQDCLKSTIENGRAFFEGYPEVAVRDFNCFDYNELIQDAEFIRALPFPLGNGEILRIKQEDRYGEKILLRLLFDDAGQMPYTQLVLEKINSVLTPAILYLKYHFNRARPVRLIPLKSPALEIPETPSYPSMHAAKWTMYACFVQELAENDQIGSSAKKLAKEMSKRRVLSGVSFPSDVKAGEHIGEQICKILIREKCLEKLLEEAKKELHGLKMASNGKEQIVENSFQDRKDEILDFHNCRFSDFLMKLGWIMKKSIYLEMDKDIIVNERFKIQEARMILGIIAEENGLKMVEDAEVIRLFENKSNESDN